ncbi:MAG: hypothetical protein PHH54_06715 [Candidatus Nanoarchaeia archaeon]|nr:hypothetical protein [Candidatus Nanoarchaeia archaeon]MDD5741647.1 hypothetical protein [Candidatus Nanoarchaeia archaeon]
MNKNKRGQSEIITTVLIILLVLAAIVIVWQVVKSTVESGSEQVSSQSSCMGVSLSMSNTSNTVFIVKRDASGGSFTTTDVAVVRDGTRLAKDTGYALSANTLKDPLGTGTVTFTTAPTTSVEIAIIGDTTTCPATAELSAAEDWK